VLGRSPREVRVKAQIGYMPEESNLYRFLNAEETLDFYGRLFNFGAADRKRRTEALLDLVGLRKERRRALHEYSKGMARRIGLAQALVNDPELLILDEPTAGLDPIGTREFKDLIVELKRRGKTVLLCSHLLADVEDVCDRIAILYGGSLQAQGRVDELLKRGDVTQITASGRLGEGVTARVREAIAAAQPGVKVRVEAPRERLEALFLRIVEEARQARQATSGAEAGIAARELHLGAEPAQGRALLDKLVSGEPEPDASPASAASSEPSLAVDEKRRDVLDRYVSEPGLTADTKAKPADDEGSSPDGTPTPARRVKRSVLEGLVKGEDGAGDSAEDDKGVRPGA
ncbi:MAG: ABC transporter ATP-binding protein, partial [Verrucomicrobia bacterium]|nr:ABC transporter ATP-binding protein [Verrucomicrobiota bacterium]